MSTDRRASGPVANSFCPGSRVHFHRAQTVQLIPLELGRRTKPQAVLRMPWTGEVPGNRFQSAHGIVCPVRYPGEILDCGPQLLRCGAAVPAPRILVLALFALFEVTSRLALV